MQPRCCTRTHPGNVRASTVTDDICVSSSYVSALHSVEVPTWPVLNPSTRCTGAGGDDDDDAAATRTASKINTAHHQCTCTMMAIDRNTNTLQRYWMMCDDGTQPTPPFAAPLPTKHNKPTKPPLRAPTQELPRNFGWVTGCKSLAARCSSSGFSSPAVFANPTTACWWLVCQQGVLRVVGCTTHQPPTSSSNCEHKHKHAIFFLWFFFLIKTCKYMLMNTTFICLRSTTFVRLSVTKNYRYVGAHTLRVEY